MLGSLDQMEVLAQLVLLENTRISLVPHPAPRVQSTLCRQQLAQANGPVSAALARQEEMEIPVKSAQQENTRWHMDQQFASIATQDCTPRGSERCQVIRAWRVRHCPLLQQEALPHPHVGATAGTRGQMAALALHAQQGCTRPRQGISHVQSARPDHILKQWQHRRMKFVADVHKELSQGLLVRPHVRHAQRARAQKKEALRSNTVSATWDILEPTVASVQRVQQDPTRLLMEAAPAAVVAPDCTQTQARHHVWLARKIQHQAKEAQSASAMSGTAELETVARHALLERTEQQRARTFVRSVNLASTRRAQGLVLAVLALMEQLPIQEARAGWTAFLAKHQGRWSLHNQAHKRRNIQAHLQRKLLR